MTIAGVFYRGWPLIATYGFPIGGTFQERDEPTPRIFRGFTVRLADFASGGSGSYRAYELSFPAPRGLSGGPVFIPGSDRVFAMVTGVLESESIVEEIHVSESERVHWRRLIGYGMALSLRGVEDWLRNVAPLSGHAAW